MDELNENCLLLVHDDEGIIGEEFDNKVVKVTVKEYIENYLIKEIGEIKDEHPYFAFLLMAVGIEFLGKCQNTDYKWNKTGQAERDFNLGMGLFPAKYQNMKLFERLRCGMAHPFITQNGIQIYKSLFEDATVISCDDFYKDFTEACNKIVSGNVEMPRKKLTNTFLFVQDIDGDSVSGSTINNQRVFK